MSKPEFRLPYPLLQDDIVGPACSSAAAVEFCLGDLALYPFRPAGSDRLCRACDFTYSTQQRQQRGPAAQHQEEDSAFLLVDSRPVKLHRSRMPKRIAAPVQQVRSGPRSLQPQSQVQLQQTVVNKNQQRYHMQQQARQQAIQRTNRQRQMARWSIEPDPTWSQVDVRSLMSLSSTGIPVDQIKFEDLSWSGELREYMRMCDKILPRANVPLQGNLANKLSFYWPTTADDKVLINTFLEDSSITVIATDQIIATLMAAPQSRLSWHLNVYKDEGRLIIDKDNASAVDSLTVDETHRDPPMPDCPIKINRPAELAAEALKINQVFSQQVLDNQKEPIKRWAQPPFVEQEDHPASKAYRYRFIEIPPASPEESAIRLLTRCEIDGILSGNRGGNSSSATDPSSPPDDQSLTLLKALNEYSPARSAKPWRIQLESQRGGLLALEAKNNHCKVAKWTCQAMLGSVSHIKIGFVTRTQVDSSEKHTLLAVLDHSVSRLCQQLGIKEETAWGCLRSILTFIMAQPDGRYVLVKDPVKPELKLFAIPES